MISKKHRDLDITLQIWKPLFPPTLLVNSNLEVSVSSYLIGQYKIGSLCFLLPYWSIQIWKPLFPPTLLVNSNLEASVSSYLIGQFKFGSLCFFLPYWSIQIWKPLFPPTLLVNSNLEASASSLILLFSICISTKDCETCVS